MLCFNHLVAKMLLKPTVLKSTSLITIIMSMLAYPAQAEEWKVVTRSWQDAEQQVFDDAVERHSYGAVYKWGESSATRELTYEHQAILIRAGEPASNGYFHRLDLLTGAHQPGSLQLAATVGIHGSSNMFQKFEFHSDILVGSYSARYPLGRMQVGINGDYRFGNRFHTYPVIAGDSLLTDGSVLTLELPVRFSWQSADNAWQLSVERYGEKWAALDSETDAESATYFNEWQLQGNACVWEGSAWSLYLLAGWSFDSKIRYLDLLQGQLSTELEESLFVGIEANF